jgi:hypothetical protein
VIVGCGAIVNRPTFAEINRKIIREKRPKDEICTYS